MIAENVAMDIPMPRKICKPDPKAHVQCLHRSVGRTHQAIFRTPARCRRSQFDTDYTCSVHIHSGIMWEVGS